MQKLKQAAMAGEVGLSGEIRPVNRIEQRIQLRPKSSDSKRMLIPKHNLSGIDRKKKNRAHPRKKKWRGFPGIIWIPSSPIKTPLRFEVFPCAQRFLSVSLSQYPLFLNGGLQEPFFSKFAVLDQVLRLQLSETIL